MNLNTAFGVSEAIATHPDALHKQIRALFVEWRENQILHENPLWLVWAIEDLLDNYEESL